MINNLYREWPAIKGDLILDDKEQYISNHCFTHQIVLPAPQKLIMTFPLPNDEQLRSGMSGNTSWHIPSTYEASHLELLLFGTK